MTSPAPGLQYGLDVARQVRPCIDSGGRGGSARGGDHPDHQSRDYGKDAHAAMTKFTLCVWVTVTFALTAGTSSRHM